MTYQEIFELGENIQNLIAMIRELLQSEVLCLSHPSPQSDYYIGDIYGNYIRIDEKLYAYLHEMVKGE